MSAYKEAPEIKAILEKADKIVIVQADNPDGDSLASALALEQILHEMGKEPYLYCGIDMPSYLRYLPGWDRVSKDLPNQFDANIIVDCSSQSLLETAGKNGHTGWLAAKPTIIIDHHDVEGSITFANVTCNYPTAASTGEVLYELAHELGWPLNQTAKNMLTISILADTLGLMSQATTSRTIHIVAELVEQGVSLPELDEARRELMRKSVEIIRYKGELLQRIAYHSDNRVATIDIPWDEIEKYSQMYNPSVLALEEMRLTEGVDVAIAFKIYPDGKVTGKIRCNYGKPIAGQLAEHFGGGGHPYASGFKIISGKPFNEVKSECIGVATTLLDNLKQG